MYYGRLGWPLALLLAPSLALAQSGSEPERSPLLALTQEWAAASPLGDLRFAQLEPEDLELRVMAGYGLVGTRGYVLQRRRGIWNAYRTTVHTCQLFLPIDVGDTLSPESIQRYERQAREQCGERRDSALRAARVISVDTIAIHAIQFERWDELWRKIEDAGLTTLPRQEPSGSIYEDGHRWIIELKKGSTYSATEIELRRSKTEAVVAFADQLTTMLDHSLKH